MVRRHGYARGSDIKDQDEVAKQENSRLDGIERLADLDLEPQSRADPGLLSLEP